MEKKFSLTDMNGITENDKEKRSYMDINGKSFGDDVYGWKRFNDRDKENYSLNDMCGYTNQQPSKKGG